MHRDSVDPSTPPDQELVRAALAVDISTAAQLLDEEAAAAIAEAFAETVGST